MRAAALIVLAAVVLAGCGSGKRTVTTAAKPSVAVRRDPVRAAPIRRLVPTTAGSLASPIQDAAGARFGGGAVLIGGLTPADVSSDGIVTATRAGSRTVGRIPQALHDSAAVTLGHDTYLF